MLWQPLPTRQVERGQLEWISPETSEWTTPKEDGDDLWGVVPSGSAMELP